MPRPSTPGGGPVNPRIESGDGAATTKHGYRAQRGRVLDDIRRIVTIQTRMLVLRRALGADAIAALSDPLS